MSAKCEYSSKYYPLLRGIYAKDVNDNTEELKNFVNEHFLDPEKVFRTFMSGVVTNSTQTPEWNPKLVSSRSGIKVKTEIDDTQELYIGKHIEYKNMESDFTKKIISLSVFDLSTENFINPEQVIGDTTLLNKGILDYKKSLLQSISEYLKEPITNLNTLSESELDEIFKITLNKFESIVNNVTDFDANYYKAYNAYAILKTFDSLLKKVTPFITINPEYKNASQFNKRKYKYNGPNIEHDTGFNNNGNYDIKDATSDLAKILLTVIPEINVNGEIIEHTSIGLSGFNSVMCKLKAWAEGSSNSEIQEELKKGTPMNVKKLIDLYEDALRTNNDIMPEHITYLRSKLAGIRRYIYNPKMSQDIKNMFTHLMEKTVVSSYVIYTQPNLKFNMEVHNITERTIYLQKYFIDDVVKSATLYWSKNSNKFNELLKKYNITFQTGKIKIDEAVIEKLPNGKIIIQGNISNFNQIVRDIAQLIVFDDFDEVAYQVNPKNNSTAINLYTPVLATIIHNVFTNTTNKVDYGQARDLAKVLSVINGSDVINVVKNPEGNNLPLHQLICLAYSHRAIYNEITKQIEDNEDISSPYLNNAVYRNIQYIKNPRIRSHVVVGNTTQISAKLNEHDIMHLAIVYDYFNNLISKQSDSDTANSQVGIIGVQTHCYSDKNKHYIMQFDLNKTWDFGSNLKFNIKQVLDNYFKTGKKEDINKLLDAWYYTNKQQIQGLVSKVLEDYRIVTGEKFETLSDIKKFLKNYLSNKKHTIDDLRKSFFENNIEFIDEIHASKLNGEWTVNETMEHVFDIFSDRTKFNIFIEGNFDQFLRDSKKAWTTISKDNNIINYFEEKLPQFVDKNKLLLRDKNDNINPLLYSYFIIDSFLGNEYNKMMVGEVFVHPNKNKEKPTSENYLTHSLAARWIAQVKRMVIYGATYHSYAQGLKNGVPERVKMAVMPDIGSSVNNIIGVHSEVDSMDGSGLTSPFLSRWQNVSLIDATVNWNKKTIYHDINSRYEVPKLLKWAEYEITNALRRSSVSVSLENIFKKMHDFDFSGNINYSKSFDNLYFRDKNTGKYYKIKQIVIENNTASRTLVEVNKYGQEVSQEFPDLMPATSIYKLDQIFGGAWAMEINKNTNDLQYSENNLDYTNQIICDYNLKDSMIGWLVNKSALKVGTSNLNSENTWFDDSPLLYTTMSTKFGGVQMDADHELDDAEVTEMTQMISALEQLGFTHDIADQIYQQIGKFCHDAIAKIQDTLYKGDKDELYKIFGKAVVKAFQTGTKDTLGLAQSFVRLAQQDFIENKIDYKIPFSSSSINGIFNSTVTSSLVRDAIRRHYNGVAAVLNPSYNIMQYFSIAGNNYKYDELIDVVNEVTKGTNLEGLTVDQAINNVFIEDKLGNNVTNPFILEITPDDPIDFEDTIVIFNDPNGDGTYNRLGETTILPYEVKKITTYEDYDYYKHYEHRKMYRWSIKPRNLKGADTTFVANGKKYSMYESPYTKALHYLIESKLASVNLDDLKEEIKAQVTKELSSITSNPIIIKEVFDDRWNNILNIINIITNNDPNPNLNKYWTNIKKFLIDSQQQLLNSIADKKSIQWGSEILTPESYNVRPAQIIMGKLYAKQLGLLPGDSIAKIKDEGPEFFKNRIAGYYNDDNPNSFSYDWVLFDGTGEKLYVKLKTDNISELYPNSSTTSDYKVIDNVVYHNSKEICSANGKQFINYLDDDNITRNVVIIDTIDRLHEIQNSKMFNVTQRNYRYDNYKQLVEEEFGIGNPIQLTSRNDKNKWTTRNIAEFENDKQIINALIENQDYHFDKKIEKLAKAKYESFKKSLMFVGTRIPCQSMQSFAPMEIVAFTDSEINEIYVPTEIFFLQGSDLDKLSMFK